MRCTQELENYDVLMKKYMVEELQDSRSYDWWAKHGPWSLAMDGGRFAMDSTLVL